MTQPIECLCAGILVADHLCAPIDHLPVAGELILADELPLALGGCAANVSMDLAKLGVRATTLGCVGDDAFGRYIVESLTQAGVDAARIKSTAAAPTSGTLIINVAGEDRRFIHCIGANGTFSAADFPVELFAGVKLLYLGGYLLMPSLRAQELAQVFAAAQKAGVMTALDVVVPGPGEHWSAVAPLLPHTDYFFPNDDEAEIITGLSDPDAQAQRFRAAGARTVVITRGEHGALLLNKEQRIVSRPYSMPYVGGAGAGDAFVAGYLAGLLAGQDPLTCLGWGSATGASCVRSITTTDGVFKREELLEYLRKNPLSCEVSAVS